MGDLEPHHSRGKLKLSWDLLEVLKDDKEEKDVKPRAGTHQAALLVSSSSLDSTGSPDKDDPTTGNGELNCAAAVAASTDDQFEDNTVIDRFNSINAKLENSKEFTRVIRAPSKRYKSLLKNQWEQKNPDSQQLQQQQQTGERLKLESDKNSLPS